MEQQKAKRGRPAGSKNKEAFTHVKLEDLLSVLKPNVNIPVDTEFANTIKMLLQTSSIQNNNNVYEAYEENDTYDEEDLNQVYSEPKPEEEVSSMVIVRHKPTLI